MSRGLGGHPFFMHPRNLTTELNRGIASSDHQKKAGRMIEELWRDFEEREAKDEAHKAEIGTLTGQLIAIKDAIGGNLVPLVAQLDEARRREWKPPQ